MARGHKRSNTSADGAPAKRKRPVHTEDVVKTEQDGSLSDSLVGGQFKTSRTTSTISPDAAEGTASNANRVEMEQPLPSSWSYANVRACYGSALVVAVEDNYVETVKVLLNRCAKEMLRTDLSECFGLAACISNVEVLELLVDECTRLNMLQKKDIREALVMASDYGLIDHVKVILLKGAGFLKQSHYQQAFESAVNQSAVYGSDHDPEHIWEGQDHISVMKLLLQKGASFQAHNRHHDMNSLRMAFKRGRFDVVEFLIEHGIGVDLKGIDCGRNLETALKQDTLGS